MGFGVPRSVFLFCYSDFGCPQGILYRAVLYFRLGVGTVRTDTNAGKLPLCAGLTLPVMLTPHLPQPRGRAPWVQLLGRKLAINSKSHCYHPQQQQKRQQQQKPSR